MLLKTLFCFEGADQGARFALINSAAYLSFITFYFIFWHIPAFLLLILATLVFTVTASAIRRVNDATLPKVYSLIAPSVFAAISGIIMFSGNPASYALLLIGAVATLALTLPSTKQPGNYVFGYHGPKNTVVPTTPIANRIEPTFVDGSGEQAVMSEQDQNAVQSDELGHAASTTDWVQPLRDWYQGNQKVAMVGAAVVSLAALITTIMPSFEFEQAPKEVVQQPINPVTPQKLRDYALEMPSDYFLMLDDNDGLIIHWRTSDDDNASLWSLLTGKGDQTCQALVFNDNSEIRTTMVSIEDGGDYYADISPLDTKKAVKAIADKSNFTLCGYDFSLKGSRSTIDGSETYYVFLQ